MKFSMCIMEMEGYKYSHFLYDVCKNYCYIIERAGYECCMVRNTLYSDRINIIMGTHTLTDPAKVEQIISSGKYVILQSEVLRENGIAGWPDQKTFHTIYVPLMKRAQAVWDGLEINHPHLRKLGIEPELSVTRFGYLPSMEEIHHKKKKDIDFLYFGSLTPHRKKLIDNLKAKGGNVVYAFDEAAIFRNDLIARARVNLAPNQAPGINHVTSKVLYLLNNRCVVVVERCGDQDWVEHCFPSADTEEWVDLCLETIRRPELDQLAGQYFEQYKKLDMTDMIRPLLDKLRPAMPTLLKGDIILPEAEEEPLLPRLEEKKAIPGLTSIIIVTHDRLEYTKKCLKRLRRHTPELHEIIFVDNASTDGTVKWLQSQIKEDKNCRLIENHNEDVGLARGRNQGINMSRGEFIVLLDNDASVSDGWLSALRDCWKYAPAAGIIGPMTNSAAGLQQVSDASCQSLDYLDKYAAKFKERFHHRRIPQRNIAGFCMMFKRALAENVGLLDEGFGETRFENEDFCLRAAMADYQNYIAGDVFIHHSGDGLSQTDRAIIQKKWTLSLSLPEGKKLAVIKTMEFAEELYSKGKTDQAVETLISCIKLLPDAKEIYYALTRIFIESKRFSEAWEVVESMPENAVHDLSGLECIAYTKEGLGRDGEAAACVSKMLLMDDNCSVALNLKGVLAYKKGEKDAAQDNFKKAIQADPGHGEAYTNLGVLYWGMDKHEEAFAYLQRGFVLSPTVPDVSSLYYTVLSSLDAYNVAETDFEEASRLFPNSKNLAFLLIDLFIRQGKSDLAMLKIEDALAVFGLDDGTLDAALAVRDKIGPLQIEKTSSKGTLSLCMIVKNEEKYLVQCLKSVRDVVDEIIIVDTGSTDKTADIARVFGARLFEFPWTGDFSAARNHSLAQATGSWILVLDGDEVISSQDFGELKSLVRKRQTSPVAYSIVTRNYINNMGVIGWTPKDGQYPEEAGAGWVISAKVRLVPRRKDIFFSNPVHETLEASLNKVNIPVRPCNVIVHHYGKLDVQKDIQKGEDYYLLGKIKYESDPTNVKYIYELAKQAHQLHKNDETMELWLKLLSLIEADPESPGYREIIKISYGDPLPEIYTQLAASCLLLGRYEEALKSAVKAVGGKVKLKEYVYVYAQCEMIAGSLEKSFSALEDLLKTAPDYAPALFLKTVVFCLEGKKEKARDLFEHLRQKRVQITPQLNIIANQLQSNGRKNEALLILNAMIENKLNDSETATLLKMLDRETEPLADG